MKRHDFYTKSNCVCGKCIYCIQKQLEENVKKCSSCKKEFDTREVKFVKCSWFFRGERKWVEVCPGCFVLARKKQGFAETQGQAHLLDIKLRQAKAVFKDPIARQMFFQGRQEQQMPRAQAPAKFYAPFFSIPNKEVGSFILGTFKSDMIDVRRKKSEKTGKEYDSKSIYVISNALFRASDGNEYKAIGCEFQVNDLNLVQAVESFYPVQKAAPGRLPPPRFMGKAVLWICIGVNEEGYNTYEQILNNSVQEVIKEVKEDPTLQDIREALKFACTYPDVDGGEPVYHDPFAENTAFAYHSKLSDVLSTKYEEIIDVSTGTRALHKLSQSLVNIHSGSKNDNIPF